MEMNLTTKIRKILPTLPTTWGVVAERRWLLDKPQTLAEIADSLDIDIEDVYEIDKRVIEIALGNAQSPLAGLI